MHYVCIHTYTKVTQHKELNISVEMARRLYCAHIRLINLRYTLFCKGGYHNHLWPSTQYNTTIDVAAYNFCKISTLYFPINILCEHDRFIMGYSRRYKSEHSLSIGQRDMMVDFDLFHSMTAELCYESLRMAPLVVYIQYDVRDWLDFGLSNVNNGITQCSF